MTNNVDLLPPIPAQRYFSLEELCELVQINPTQFARWQHEHAEVIGYGGNSYTRRDVIKLRKLKDTFAPFVDEFNGNAVDSEGNPSLKADEVRDALQKILAEIEKKLANQAV